MPHDRVGGAGGPVARNDDEARASALPRRSDDANGPPPPPTRRAGPERAAGRRRSSSTAGDRLVSSSLLGTTRSVVRPAFPARRGRGACVYGAVERAGPLGAWAGGAGCSTTSSRRRWIGIVRS